MKHIKMILAGILALTLTACSDTNTAEETALLSETTSDTVLTEEIPTATEAADAVTTALESESTNEETVTTLEEVTTVSETEAAEINVDYKKDYAEYLNNQTFWEGGLYIGDINGDGIPEAVIEINECESTVILYYNENGMQELELWTMSDKGYVRYLPDTNQIVYSEYHFRGGAGNEIYSWENRDYIKTFSMSRLAYGEGEDIPQAYIDDAEVDRDTFESKLLEFEKYRDEGEYFPVISVNDENFESYVKENLPEFNNWDIIQK